MWVTALRILLHSAPKPRSWARRHLALPELRNSDKMEEYMRVKNLNGGTQNKCSSGSWLAHWEKFSGQNAYMCFGKGCINRPSVGGHVQKDSTTDKNWYIVPLCDDCNKKRGQDLDIWALALLIPANESETCEMPAVALQIFARRALDRFPEERLTW